MLIKLCRHEFKATARTLVWMYAAFVAIAVVNFIGSFGVGGIYFVSGGDAAQDADVARGLFSEQAVGGVVKAVVALLYTLAAVAMAILTVVVVIQRFYRNLLGDEGYLTLTLPASREQHVLAKLIAATAWTVLSMALVVVSIVLMLWRAGHLADVRATLRAAAESGVPVGQWAALLAANLLVAVVAGILMLYAAMAVGPNLLKNRVGGSFLAYIGIVVVYQVVSLAILWIFGKASGLEDLYTQGGFGFLGNGVADATPVDGAAAAAGAEVVGHPVTKITPERCISSAGPLSTRPTTPRRRR